MRILALDLATKTGFAYWNDKRIESGVQDFSLKRGDGDGMRYLRFARWLDEMFAPIARQVKDCLRYQDDPGFQAILGRAKRGAVDLVIYEKCSFIKYGRPTEILNGLLTRLQEACEERGVTYTGVEAAALKRFATGKGNAGKPAMIEAAQKRYPDIQIIDDNHADALLLLAYAREEYDGK